MRTKDSKRSKVYAAENKALAAMRAAGLVEREEMTQAQMQRRLKTIAHAKWTLRRYKQLGTNVPLRFDRQSWATGGSLGMRFPPRGPLLNKLTLLHELAHVIQHRTPFGHLTAGHGREWAAVYVALTQRFLGRQCAALLKQHFRAAKIPFGKPRAKRVLTEEQKQVLRDRLAAARAARRPT